MEKETIERNDGNIKIQIAFSSELTKEEQDELIINGIQASDIIEIHKYVKPVENEYSKTGIRGLPEPIEISIDFSETDEEDLFLGLCRMRAKSGFKLTPR